VRNYLLVILFLGNYFYMIHTVHGFNNRAIKVTSNLNGINLYKQYNSINHALIIGIDNYEHHPDLKTAVNDANAIAEILEKRYFFDKKNMILLLNKNATKQKVIKSFEDLITLKVHENDNVFIYYAGHGWFDKTFQIGYWVTSEATKNKTSFLQNNTIYQAIAALDRKKVKHIFLVSDSCFSGSFIKKHRDVETEIDDKYFQKYYSKPSRSVLTSGGNEPVSDSGKEGHSIFAYYFIKQLEKNPFPYLSVKQLGYQVECLVTRNSDQKPISKYIHGVGDEDGQFFFINNNKSLSIKPKNNFHKSETVLNEIINKSIASKQEWDNWQLELDSQYNKVLTIDKDNNTEDSDKLIAWKSFVSTFTEDNPYSDKDEKYRVVAKKKIITLTNNIENVKNKSRSRRSRRSRVDLRRDRNHKRLAEKKNLKESNYIAKQPEIVSMAGIVNYSEGKDTNKGLLRFINETATYEEYENSSLYQKEIEESKQRIINLCNKFGCENISTNEEIFNFYSNKTYIKKVLQITSCYMIVKGNYGDIKIKITIIDPFNTVIGRFDEPFLLCVSQPCRKPSKKFAFIIRQDRFNSLIPNGYGPRFMNEKNINELIEKSPEFLLKVLLHNSSEIQNEYFYKIAKIIISYNNLNLKEKADRIRKLIVELHKYSQNFISNEQQILESIVGYKGNILLNKRDVGIENCILFTIDYDGNGKEGGYYNLKVHICRYGSPSLGEMKMRGCAYGVNLDYKNLKETINKYKSNCMKKSTAKSILNRGQTSGNFMGFNKEGMCTRRKSQYYYLTDRFVEIRKTHYAWRELKNAL